MHYVITEFVFLLATCLWVQDIDAIWVFLFYCLPVQVCKSASCVRRLHDVRALHHLSQDRHPACKCFMGKVGGKKQESVRSTITFISWGG